MRYKICRALVYCIVWVTFSFGSGIFGSIQAAQALDTDSKLYFIFFSFTAFWSGLLIVAVGLRIHSINPGNASIHNSSCFRSSKILLNSIILNQDFQFQRYVAMSLVVIQFHTTISILNRNAVNTNSFNGFRNHVFESIFVFVVSFIFGVLTQLYLVINIVKMFADYREYQRAIIYFVHIKETIEEEIEFKKRIATLAIIFTFLSSVYYIIKVALYSQVINATSEKSSLQVFSAFVIIQSLACIVLCGRVCRSLLNIFRNISNLNDPQIFNSNLECFFGWFVLVKSLVFSRKNRFWRNIIFTLQLIQTIYGLIAFPFFKLYQITVQQIYSEESYLYCDTAVITFFFFWRFADAIARLFHQVKTRLVAFDTDQSVPVVAPLGPNAQILEQIEYRGIEDLRQLRLPRLSSQQEQIAQKDFGDCCICLDKMKEGERIYNLKCHPAHLFHYYCISKWMVNHNSCPLCQQTIY